MSLHFGTLMPSDVRPHLPIRGAGWEASIPSHFAPSSLRSDSSRKLDDERRMRSARGSSYILRGHRNSHPRRHALIARNSPPMHGFAGGVCSGAAWMPDQVRHDSLTQSLRARPAIHAPMTTVSPARHGLRVKPAMTTLAPRRTHFPRLSCRTRSGIHAGPNKPHPQSRAWADCSSRSGHVA